MFLELELWRFIGRGFVDTKLMFWVAVVVAGLCGVAGVEAGEAVEERPVVVPKLEGGKPNPMYERNMAFVARLDEESLEMGLKNLSEVEPFCWPGVPGHGARGVSSLKRNEEADLRDVQVIMSNRRVLKLMEELKKMEAEKAGALVGASLERALKAYAAEYEMVVAKRKAQEAALKGKQALGGGMSFMISDVKGGPPTLMGLRYEVLSLVLIAGNLGLTGAQESVDKVAAYGRGQYQDLMEKSKEELAMMTRDDLLERAALYSRFVMATGMLGVSKDRELPAGVKKEVMVLTRYNAAVTVGDGWKMGRADFSKGRIEMFFLSGVKDGDFNPLI
jgi:hypothetical protein